MDLYIRVSRVGGRKGESYRSPKQQEDAMRAWAEREGVTVGLRRRPALAPVIRVTNPRQPGASIRRHQLLSGVITCASCGGRLNIMGRKDGKGERKASYVCTVNYRGGKKQCDAPAIGTVAVVDAHVLQLVNDDVDSAVAGLTAGEEAYVEAREALQQAEDELGKFTDPSLSTELGAHRWRRGLARASERVREAKTRCGNSRNTPTSRMRLWSNSTVARCSMRSSVTTSRLTVGRCAAQSTP